MSMTKLEMLSDYWNNSAVSQSYLKSLIGMKPPSESTAFKGKLIDTMLTMSEHVDDLFIIGNDDFPDNDSTSYKMVKCMVDNNMPFNDAEILEIHELFNHQTNWKDATKVAKFQQYEKLYQFIIDADGKTIVSDSEFQQAANIIDILKGYIPKYVQYQVPLYATIDGVKCKGLADFIEGGNTADTIWDLKVLSISLKDVKYSLRKMRTDFQQAFYKELLGTDKLPKLLIYSNIDHDAMVYEMTEEDMYIGAYGFEKYYDVAIKGVNKVFKTKVYGFYDALDIYNGKLNQEKEKSIWR